MSDTGIPSLSEVMTTASLARGVDRLHVAPRSEEHAVGAERREPRPGWRRAARRRRLRRTPRRGSAIRGAAGDSHESVGPLHGRESPDVRDDVARAAQPELFAARDLAWAAPAGRRRARPRRTGPDGRCRPRRGHRGPVGRRRRAVVRRASRRSAITIARVVAGLKYPRSRWPWYVWTVAGTPTIARRDAAQHPGLGLVRVHDVGPELADDPDDGDKGPHIVPGRGGCRDRALPSPVAQVRECGRSRLHRTSRCP